MTDIILASGSPRRKELLEQINIPFIVQISQVEETLPEGLSPQETVEHLALLKASAVAEHTAESFVVGADTIVVLDGERLGKPLDRQDAKKMLKRLSGRTHSVYTGVAIKKGNSERIFHEKTDVTFWELSEEEIESYLDSGESFDKAGSYGIQGLGAVFVKRMDGDYFSVVGLPLSSLYRHLKQLGWK